MIRSRNAKLVAAAGLVSAVATATPAEAALPVYPMIAITISARAGQVPTATVSAQAPAFWTCSQPTWGFGTYVVACTPPAAPPGFENVCAWNIVTVTSAGIPGFGPLNARASCDGDPGAAASTNSGGTNQAATLPNIPFSTFFCSAAGGVNEPAMRPWTVNCTVDH